MPICHDCNKPGAKHQTPPLTASASDQTSDWFHPFLRAAVGQYGVEIRHEDGGPIPVLVSDDPQAQTRLDNLSSLVKLKPRWRQQLSLEIRLRHRDIERETRRRKHSLDESELCELFEEWAERVEEVEKGRIGFALLRQAYLHSVSQRSPLTFVKPGFMPKACLHPQSNPWYRAEIGAEPVATGGFMYPKHNLTIEKRRT